MRRWTEGFVHLAMRKALRGAGFTLIAGEFPGGSDHELYPLNVVDPTVARDRSPDPRRHSVGELIPDIVALKDRGIVIGEAKVNYNESDKAKLEDLVSTRRADLRTALEKFAHERGFPQLLPFDTLVLFPTLVFTDERGAPPVNGVISYMRINTAREAIFEGPVSSAIGA
jgi:hypothetical protein